MISISLLFDFGAKFSHLRGTFPQVGNHLWKIFRHFGEGEKDTCSPGAADATPSERESINDDFSAWWQHYPRKVGKGHAMKAYRAARRKTDHATLVAAVDAQAERLMAKGSEFCPHPATWLNGERWADETTTSPPIDDAPDESWISKPAPDWMYDADLVEKLIEEASGG